LYKTTEELNCIEPSLSVRLPWFLHESAVTIRHFSGQILLFKSSVKFSLAKFAAKTPMKMPETATGALLACA